MNWEDEFIKGIQSIEIIPEPVIEYRFYYDNTGKITNCSQTNHQDCGNYLVVTAHEYKYYYQYYIENDRLKMIDNAPGYRVQLKSSTQGYAVINQHAGILVEPNETYTNIEYYAANN